MKDVRTKLKIERLSSMSRERAESVVKYLEVIAHDRNLEPPAGGWVGRHKDTLVASANGRIIGSVTVQIFPTIEPLVLDDSMASRAILEPLVRRAEGYIQGQGYDEYVVMLDEKAAASWRDYVTRGGEEHAVSGDLVVREL